ncbi:hypothetical protein [Streptomyces sp. NPDC002851]
MWHAAPGAATTLRERAPDIADCPVQAGPICSLCCSLDAECGDVCRKSPAAEPVLMPLPTVRTAD